MRKRYEAVIKCGGEHTKYWTYGYVWREVRRHNRYEESADEESFLGNSTICKWGLRNMHFYE